MDKQATAYFLPLVGCLVFLGVVLFGAVLFFGGLSTAVVMLVPGPTLPTTAPTRVDLSFLPSTPPTETATSTPEVIPQSPSSTVSLLFVGDIMLDRNVRLRSLKAETRSYPFQKLPPGWFEQADFAIANLEGPVTDRRRAPEKSIDFLFDPEVLEALKATGLDAFSQANNHALDQGAPGYEDSIQRLRQAGFLAFGHQVQDGEISLATTTVKGIRFAFMGWNTTDNPLDRAAAQVAIERATQEADVLIAYLHWGPEYRNTPHPNEVLTAHWLIDQGIDAVIGGHPHWVQGLSVYKGKPIAWSLGNFIFDQDFSLETRQGLALRLAVDTQGIVAIEPIPLQIDQSQPRVLEGENRQTRLNALAAISDPALASSTVAGLWTLRASE